MAQPILYLSAPLFIGSLCAILLFGLRKHLIAPVRLLHVLEQSDDDITFPYGIVKDIDDRFVTDFIGKISDSSVSYARLMQELGHTVLEDAKDYIENAEIEVENRLRFDSLLNATNYYSKTSSLIIICKLSLHSAINDRIMQVGDNFETIVRASQRPVLAASQEVKPITKVFFLYDDIRMNEALNYFLCHQLFWDKNCRLGFLQNVFPTISKEIAYFRSLLEQENIHLSSLQLNDDCNEEMLNNLIEDNDIDLIVLSAFNESKFGQVISGYAHRTLIQKIKIPVIFIRNNN